jgi:hypothetical protein
VAGGVDVAAEVALAGWFGLLVELLVVDLWCEFHLMSPWTLF